VDSLEWMREDNRRLKSGQRGIKLLVREQRDRVRPYGSGLRLVRNLLEDSQMSLTVLRTWLFSSRSISGSSLLLIALFLPSMACSPTSSTGNQNSNGNTNTNDNGSGSGESFTVTFDGDGGITSSGTTDFAFNGASFSGGTVKTVGVMDLYGSGLFAYEVLDGSTVTVMFDNPIDSLGLFFVTRGDGQTNLTARDADGVVVGTATAAQPDSGNEVVTVTLSADATSVEVVHTGDGEGWIDDFQFRFASGGGA